MSKPTSRYADKLNGLLTQIIGAKSALAMEPRDMPPTGPFLRDKDKWARHADHHLNACLEILGDLLNERRLEYERARLRLHPDA